MNGVATFANLSLQTAGQGFTLGASGGALPAITSNAFNVSTGVATQLAFGVQPSTVMAGGDITPAVTVLIEDAYGNVVTTSSATVMLSLAANPASATLTGPVNLPTVNGVATFSGLGVDIVGTGYKLTAVSSSLASATSGAFSVTPGAPSRLAFSAQPADIIAGAPLPTVTVLVQDAYGNTATSATTSVTLGLATNPGNTALVGTLTESASGGVATFTGLTVQKAGTGYTLGASSGALTAATSGSFNVTAGTASRLTFDTQPSTTSAGAPISPAVTVAVSDVYGNTVATASATVTLSLATNPTGTTLGGTLTQATVSGVATFGNLSLPIAGSGYTLGAAATPFTGGVSAAFSITPATAAKLAFGAQPPDTMAGETLSPAVTVLVEDAWGNTVTNSPVTVNLALGSNPTNAGIFGELSQGTVNGVATFGDLSMVTAATGYTLQATSDPLQSATSNPFNITAGTATQLIFENQPADTIAGSTLPAVTVAIADFYGNPVTSATGDVTLSLEMNPYSATLSGTLTEPAVSGIATYSDLSIEPVGSYVLVAASSPLPNGISNSFDITPACYSDTDCSNDPATPVCDTSLGKCARCTSSELGICTGGEICESDACVCWPCTCSDNSCPTDYSGDCDTGENCE